jgi:CubicO group peptidase (beta-lactamase class C family)
MRLPASMVALLSLCLFGIGCGDESAGDGGAAGGPGSDAGQESGGQDAADEATVDAPADAVVVSDAAGEDAAGDAGLDTSKLQQMMSDALAEAPAGIEGMSLIVHDAQDHRLIEVTVGDFETDRRVPVASASKLVTGLVLMRLVEEGTLQMSDTPGAVLGWTGTTAADATLDHLGAFVSGLAPDALCIYRPKITLQECVSEIGATAPLAAPGERFDYGGTHQAVAAAMAEVVSGESWATLFDQNLKTPLGLVDPDLHYVTLPKQGTGGDNPLVAGGLLATADEYMPILAVLFHKGEIAGQPWISSTLMERFGENHYADVLVGTTPPATVEFDFRYSWSSWLNCEGPVASCPVVSSPGAFGFSPWVDWEHGYYAVLAMESDDAGAGSPFSVPLMEALRSEIEGMLP